MTMRQTGRQHGPAASKRSAHDMISHEAVWCLTRFRRRRFVKGAMTKSCDTYRRVSRLVPQSTGYRKPQSRKAPKFWSFGSSGTPAHWRSRALKPRGPKLYLSKQVNKRNTQNNKRTYKYEHKHIIKQLNRKQTNKQGPKLYLALAAFSFSGSRLPPADLGAWTS